MLAVELLLAWQYPSITTAVILAVVTRYRPVWLPVAWLAALALVVAMLFHGERWPAEQAVHHLGGRFDFLWFWCS